MNKFFITCLFYSKICGKIHPSLQQTDNHLGMIVKTTLLKQLIQNLRLTARGLASASKVASTGNTAFFAKTSIHPTLTQIASEMFNDMSPINYFGDWQQHTSIRGETLKVTGAS